jgi:hypothetical protein
MKLIVTTAYVLMELLAFGPRTLSRQQSAVPTDVGWLGLYNSQLMEWLENENRLRDLCGVPDASVEWQRCRAEKLAARRLSVRLRSGPSEQATAVGSLLIVATPGRGLRSFFVPAGTRTAIQFRPDQYDSDWGYGPAFHETFLERRDTWFRLPEAPFPAGTWINATQLGDAPDVLLINDQHILSSPFGDLVVLGIDGNVLRVRLEQEPDMWCRDGEPPPLKPWRERRIPLRDLYTATGHLKLHVKYTRGC